MPEPVGQSGSSSQEQAKKLSTDSSITKDPNFINDVQKTQGIAKAIARKFGFLEHSSPEVDKLNGVSLNVFRCAVCGDRYKHYLCIEVANVFRDQTYQG